MTQRVWKFIAAATTEMATPVYNSLIQAGDRFEQAIAKLQSLLSVRSLRTVLTSAVSGGASSAADFTLMTLTVPANRLVVGDILHLVINGTVNHPNSPGTTISYWVRVGTTKVMTITYVPAANMTGQPFEFTAQLLTQSIGAAGVIACGGTMTSNTNATTSFRYTGVPSTATQDTTSSFNITVGGTFSNINAGNLMTAVMGAIFQR